jgi:hypothetical protein
MRPNQPSSPQRRPSQTTRSERWRRGRWIALHDAVRQRLLAYALSQLVTGIGLT